MKKVIEDIIQWKKTTERTIRRKKIHNSLPDQLDVEDSIPGTTKDDDKFIDADSSIDYLNKSLDLIGDSPLKKKKIQGKCYS